MAERDDVLDAWVGQTGDEHWQKEILADVVIFRRLAKYLNDNALTRTIQALADPTRREILRLLGDGDLSAGEIASNFSMSLPSVSHHLAVLKNAELVIAERNGQSIMYSLNSTVAQEAIQELMALLKVGRTKTRLKNVRRMK